METPADPQRKGRETILTLALTAVFGGGFLLFMILVSGGFFVYVAAAVLAIGVVGMLHYFLWGHALMQEVAGERAEEERRQRQQADEEFARDKIRPRRF